MFSKLTVFQTAHAMAVHAGARQALIAQNVANADTPGYRAKDLPSFSQVFAPQQHQPGTMRGTCMRSVGMPKSEARLRTR